MAVAGPQELVGRAEPLAALTSALESAAHGDPRIMLISGSAGIGKTTVVQSFAKGAGADRILRGACLGMVSANLPYSPFIQALRPGTATHTTQAAVVASMTSNEASPSEAGRWSQLRLFESALALLQELAADDTVVVVLEDLHWVDVASFDLLLYLTGNLRHEHLLIVITSRSDEPHPPSWLTEGMAQLRRSPGWCSIDLRPLTPDESRRVLDGFGHRQFGAARATQIADRAAGNPLYLRELATAPAENEATIPESLRDVVTLRTASMSATGRHAAAAVAIAGEPLHHRLLTRVMSGHGPDTAAGIREAVNARLVVADGEHLRAPHTLIGDAIVTQLLPGERTALHGELAAAVAHEASLDETARAILQTHHWLAAERFEDAIGPLVETARHATAQCAYADAARLWSQVADLWRLVTDAETRTGMSEIDVLTEVARAHRWGPTPEAAMRALDAAIALTANTPARAALLHEQRARQCNDLGRGVDGLAAITTAADLARDQDPAVRARVESTRAAMLMIRADYATSRRLCELVLDVAPETAAWERIQALSVLGVDLANLGKPDAALHALQEAMVLSVRIDDDESRLRTYVNQSYVLENLGRWDEAVATADEGLRFAEDTRMYGVAGPLLAGNKASSLIASGRLEAARQALEWLLARPGQPAALRYAELRLAEIEIDTDQLDRAEQRLGQLGLGDASDAITEQLRVLTMARLHLATHRVDDAADAVETALAAPHAEIDPLTGLGLCAIGLQALATLSERARHLETKPIDVDDHWMSILTVARQLAEQAPLPPCLDLLVLCDAEWGRLTGTADYATWNGVARRFAGSGNPVSAAYAYYRAAQAAELQSDRTHTAKALRAAHAAILGTGARRLRKQIEALATARRVTLADALPPTERSSPPNPFGLTSREREVLRVLARGYTNRQIGSALGISERTASVHVSNIIAKLHVRTRAEVVSAVHRLGIGLEEPA